MTFPAFLVREPPTVISPCYTYHTFESLSVTIELPTMTSNTCNIYRTHHHTLLNIIISFKNMPFLSMGVTTPHEFILTDDFKILVASPSDPLASQFLSSLLPCIRSNPVCFFLYSQIQPHYCVSLYHPDCHQCSVVNSIALCSLFCIH